MNAILTTESVNTEKSSTDATPSKSVSNCKFFITGKKINRSGFSLAEIMIVLVIIGAIMAFILPKIREGQDNSNIRNTRLKMSEIENKLNEYQADCGKLPTSLDFLINETGDCKNWTSNQKSKQLMTDAWVNAFQYEVSGNGYNLKSLGRDKAEGGSGPDRDFYSEGSVANQ